MLFLSIFRMTLNKYFQNDCSITIFLYCCDQMTEKLMYDCINSFNNQVISNRDAGRNCNYKYFLKR